MFAQQVLNVIMSIANTLALGKMPHFTVAPYEKHIMESDMDSVLSVWPKILILGGRKSRNLDFLGSSLVRGPTITSWEFPKSRTEIHPQHLLPIGLLDST